jgi:hypothetical protein
MQNNRLIQEHVYAHSEHLLVLTASQKTTTVSLSLLVHNAVLTPTYTGDAKAIT